MAAAFRFLTRLNLVELLGRKAKNILELMTGLEEVPESSIYYHTHRFIQQHHFLSPEPPNDFAFWVTNVLGQDSLGERLASVDTVKFPSLYSLRAAFIGILKRALEDRPERNGDCQEGEEFHFMLCRTFILPTPYEARNLKEFLKIIQQVSINSVSFHIFEARLLLEKGENDFAEWFKEIGELELARAMSRLDPYTVTLEGLRQLLIQRVRHYAKN